MVSSNLSTLRAIPEKQANIYNVYLPAAAKVRMDEYLSGPARLAQIGKMVQIAQNSLQVLLDSANTAEQAIRSKAASLIPGGPASEVGDAVRDTIRDGYKNGLDLDGILGIIMQQNDRAALGALKSLVPYYERDRDRAYKLIASREGQMYTRDELMAIAETYECDASMTPLRNNFKDLQDFFTAQTLPGAVQGSFKRLHSLYPWYGVAPERLGQIRSQGIEWEALSPDKLLLKSDFDSPSAADVANAPAPAWGGKIATEQYLVTGVSGGQAQLGAFQNKPLKGAL